MRSYQKGLITLQKEVIRFNGLQQIKTNWTKSSTWLLSNCKQQLRQVCMLGLSCMFFDVHNPALPVRANMKTNGFVMGLRVVSKDKEVCV